MGDKGLPRRQEESVGLLLESASGMIRRFLLAVCAIIGLPICSSVSLKAEKVEPTSLLPEGRIVLAHYMTGMVPTMQAESVWASPDLYRPEGSTSAIGGMFLTQPMWSLLAPDMSLEEAVRFEMRAAQQLGVDGFQFFYPFHRDLRFMRSYNRIIAAFVKVAEQEFPDFRVCLCLCKGHAYGDMSLAERVAHWGGAIGELLLETKGSPIWLRTRQGELLFYHWVADGFAEGVDGMAHHPDQIKAVADSYQALADAVGDKVAWVYHIRKPEPSPYFLDPILEHFPAVWGWVDSDEHVEFWDDLKQRCDEKGVAYTQSVYPDYFTSKVYAKGDEAYSLLSAQQACDIGSAGLERHYRQTDLAKTQINLLQSAIDRQAEVINYITWNDWPEGHHIAPELSHNFGPSILLRYFRGLWRDGDNCFSEENVGILFYKKHSSLAVPQHAVHVRVDSLRNEPAAEDVVQLVTILKEPVSATLNGKAIGELPAGFTVTEIPRPDDAPQLHLVGRRTTGDGGVVLMIETPVGISEAPTRTDRLTFSYSSRFQKEFEGLFPFVTPVPKPVAP